MELRHIRYFIAVGEELSFVRAAKRLHISQPPLSQAIRQLETELGIELFDRARRQIELTDAGRMFMQQASLVLVQVEQASDLALRAKRGEVGQLRVGFMDPQHNILATEIFRLFLEGHPRVHLTSHVLGPTEGISAVQNGKIDLAFLRLATEAAGLVIEPILQEPLVVAMSESHPLSTRKVIPLEALSDELCILRARHVDPAFHDFVLATLKDGGTAIKIAYEQSSIYTALGTIAAGLAIALVPSSLAQLPIKHLTYRNLKAPCPSVEVEVAYKLDSKSAVLAQFLEVVRQVCGDWSVASRQFSLRREKTLVPSG